MKLIPLTKGLFAQVDDEDFEELNKYKWHATGRPGKEYAGRRMRNDEMFPQRYILMHQQIMNTLDTIKVIDHVDGKSLNNQKYNMIVGTQAQNSQNTILAINQTGVGKDWTHGTYKAYINIGGPQGTKRINVGTYATREAATLARATKIKELGL